MSMEISPMGNFNSSNQVYESATLLCWHENERGFSGLKLIELILMCSHRDIGMYDVFLARGIYEPACQLIDRSRSDLQPVMTNAKGTLQSAKLRLEHSEARGHPRGQKTSQFSSTSFGFQRTVDVLKGGEERRRWRRRRRTCSFSSSSPFLGC